MEPLFPHSLIVGILSLPGLVFFLFGIKEIIDEYRFKQEAILTKGVVVRAISSKYQSQSVESSGGTSGTTESAGGYLLLVEYTTSTGDIYSTKSKQTFGNIPETVTIGYSPNDATDIMVDGYYKSGNGKFYRLFLGFLLGVLPVLAYCFF